jgi:hypothetical protein
MICWCAIALCNAHHVCPTVVDVIDAFHPGPYVQLGSYNTEGHTVELAPGKPGIPTLPTPHILKLSLASFTPAPKGPGSPLVLLFLVHLHSGGSMHLVQPYEISPCPTLPASNLESPEIATTLQRKDAGEHRVVGMAPNQQFSWVSDVLFPNGNEK